MDTFKFGKLRQKFNWCKIIVFALLFFLAFNNQSLAQMSSGNYKIPTDSINVGGQTSSSSIYKELDTIGEVGSGMSASTTYNLNAGFLAAQSVYLSITTAGDVSMTPSISGISGGTGTGSVSWTVTTDNLAGYSLTARTITNPALRSATGNFADYTPAGANPDYNWSINAADSEFGFTPEGADINQRYKNSGSACNTGSSDAADRCWDALDTVGKVIAGRTTGNHPNGTTTTMKVQAESGTSHIQPNGNYTATVEVTVLPL